MEPLIIEATDDIPKVILDHNKEYFEISARSLPENAIVFYAPIIKWIENYINAPKEISNFIFYFEYISTSSAKQIMKMMLAIDKLAKSKKVNVHWNYDKGDQDLLQTGERLEKLTSLNFIYNEI